MNSITLGPLVRANGEIQIPGSKSLSNRILLLAALAKGTTKITNLLDSDDIRHMLNALTKLGVEYQLSADKTACEVVGNGAPFNVASADLFLGNAGTAMRPLTAALCLGHGTFKLHGEPRMHERPIGDLVDALQHLGVDVQYDGNNNYPPITINANGLKWWRGLDQGQYF